MVGNPNDRKGEDIVQDRVKDAGLGALCVLLVFGLGGCGTLSNASLDHVSSLEADDSNLAIDDLLHGRQLPRMDDESPLLTAQLADERQAKADVPAPPPSPETGQPQELAEEDEREDEFFDPFEEAEEGEEFEEYDPWESYNVLVFRFNYNLDRYLVKHLATGYDFVVPNVVQRGISNVFHNVRFAPRFFNNVFQGKLKGAGLEVSRFLINTTVGIGGLFDPASDFFDLQTPDEDFGQTLGYYGVGPGPYLMVPFYPPLTVRDGIGYVVDLALDPFNWLVVPIIKVEDWPQVVTNDNHALALNWGLRILDLTNLRSLNLEAFQGVEEATVDLYSAVRNAYLQKRAKDIRE